MGNAEQERLNDQHSNNANWYGWGPYLSERQWGTVREDYSPDGNAWDYFPHDHARSRVYRWGEDGLAGIADESQTLCFALALWNGQDPILKERLFGLNNAEGNHGEDVKELYYYLDNVPTHAYMKQLYKYPQSRFPYEQLIAENAQRTRQEREYELLDTGLFDEGRYFDVVIEYAKATPEDLLIRYTIHNRGPETAPITVLPTLWFRNRWAFGMEPNVPTIERPTSAHASDADGSFGYVTATHDRLGTYTLAFDPTDVMLLTNNETNTDRLFGQPNHDVFVKDALHDAIIQNQPEPFASQPTGTKCAPTYRFDVEAGGSVQVRLRLCREPAKQPLGDGFDQIFTQRLAEADEFYADITKGEPPHLGPLKRLAWAGLLWNKQFYDYDVERWLAGDPGHPAPPPERQQGRNAGWQHLNAHDILLMPDKWEYPWFASWDTAFQAIAIGPIDLRFAKQQLLILTTDRYRKPDGELPAYEWDFTNNNPPIEAPAAWNLYRLGIMQTGEKDLDFLRAVYDHLKINYDWWIEQKDPERNNVFEGGFLGLDNVSLFDRNKGIPAGGTLEQADGTAWMVMYSLFFMQIALELAQEDPTYEAVAIKLFGQYVAIAEAMDQTAQLWVDDPKKDPGFFHDVLKLDDGREIPLPIRSLVGLSPLFSVFTIRRERLNNLPRFYDTVQTYLNSRTVEQPCYLVVEDGPDQSHLLFSLLTCEQIDNLMPYLFREDELLGPCGIRSLSKAYTEPFEMTINDESFSIQYTPGESDTDLYGGNSNWRGPVWLPLNHVLLYALRRFGYYYDKKTVEVPVGSGEAVPLFRASEMLGDRFLMPLFPDAEGHRPVHGDYPIYQYDPHFRDLILFYEHYDGDTGRGLGASHQTGWSALITLL